MLQRVARWSWAGVACAALVAPSLPARAHETEQYSLPAGREFADLGPYFTLRVHEALADAVADVNRLAPEAGIVDDPLRAADFIAGRVWERMFLAFPTNELLDARLGRAALQVQYPGLVTLHRPASGLYDDPLMLVDVSKFVRTLLRAGTVSVNGIPFGTDKIIHFVNLGRIYHVKYIAGLQQGLSPQQATAEAIASTTRNPLTSENGLLGLASTGIRSNGDLAANYAGLLFYRNLIEPVRIGARELPPMLAHDAGGWHLLVQPDGDFFTVFITPHWNEVLNPNVYLGYVGEQVRRQILRRCDDTLDNYRDAHGHVLDHAAFAAQERALGTFYGDAYDHELEADAPVSVAGTCFGAGAEARTAADTPDAAFARTPLWWAARLGQAEQMAALWPAAAQVDGADIDGETPLHAAVRGASPQMLQWLLEHGADPNRAALYGVTPLMLAAQRGNADAAAALLRFGADPNLAGPFGQTALHASVLQGHPRLSGLLLASGARPAQTDDLGNTALHLAAARGDELQAQQLLARGADPLARNALGARPTDEAQRLGHEVLARRLGERATVAALPLRTAGSGAGRPEGTLDEGR